MLDGNLPCDPASESPSRSSLVNRAWEPLIRAVRGSAQRCRWNRHRSRPGCRGALSRTMRGRHRCDGLSGSALRRYAPSSSLPSATTSTRRLGLLKHVTVAAYILLSGNAAAYHDHIWCYGGTKFVDMSDCVVWGEEDKSDYSARNTCNEDLELTVCWTDSQYHGSTYGCDKSHPIPPVSYWRVEPGETKPVPKGEFVWWAWRCEE